MMGANCVSFFAAEDRSVAESRQHSVARYTVTDADDKFLHTARAEVTTPVRPGHADPDYLGAITASPATYRIKLAVVDDTGKRGSVEHIVRAQLTAAGQIHLTDLLLGEDSEGGGLNPAVSAEFKGGILHGYLELHSEAPESLKNATVALEIANGPVARAFDTVPARFEDDATPSRRPLAEAVVPIALLPRAIRRARRRHRGGAQVRAVSRSFRIVRTAAVTGPEVSAAAGGRPAKTPIAFTSRIDAFERGSVLTPPVVGFFLDRMNVGRNAPTTPSAAIAAARAGKFEEAIEAVKAAGNNQLVPVFLDGLARYAKGDLEGAAARFRESLRIESDFFPATFYLGACYAAGGNDRDAAGAWQTSLITEGEAPFIYTLLGDAFLRLRELDAASNSRELRLLSGNEQVQLRFAPRLPAPSRRSRSRARLILASILRSGAAVIALRRSTGAIRRPVDRHRAGRSPSLERYATATPPSRYALRWSSSGASSSIGSFFRRLVASAFRRKHLTLGEAPYLARLTFLARKAETPASASKSRS